MPDGLFGFNPNILTRYDPHYASTVVSNQYWDLFGGGVKAMELPYDSETDIAGLSTTTPYCAYIPRQKEVFQQEESSESRPTPEQARSRLTALSKKWSEHSWIKNRRL